MKWASNAAIASLLNLTLLPVIGFVFVVYVYRRSAQGGIAHYHALLGIKLNVFAAIALLLVGALMIVLGGINSPWTWIYVTLYFVLVHSMFILTATWALVRAWSGQTMRLGGAP